MDKKRVRYKSYSPAMMEAAMGAVRKEGKTVYQAAKDCSVPVNTLRGRLIAKGILKPKPPVLLQVQEAGSHASVADDLLERWHAIGRFEGLTSNVAITRFLVSMYYGASKNRKPNSALRCQECQSPLTLLCVNCKLIAPSPLSPALPVSHTAESTCDSDDDMATSEMATPDHVGDSGSLDPGCMPVAADNINGASDDRGAPGCMAVTDVLTPGSMAPTSMTAVAAPEVKTEAELSASPQSTPKRVTRLCQVSSRLGRIRSRLSCIKAGRRASSLAANDRQNVGDKGGRHDDSQSRQNAVQAGRGHDRQNSDQISRGEELSKGEGWVSCDGEGLTGDCGVLEVKEECSVISLEHNGRVAEQGLLALVEQACTRAGVRGDSDRKRGAKGGGDRRLSDKHCSEDFEASGGLQHPLVSEDCVCGECHKVFQHRSALLQHGRVHRRQDHQCPTCGLSFRFLSRLKKHLKIHGTERPHVCDKCGKSFVSVHYLRAHIKIHSEERHYKCHQCGAAFKQKPALYAHEKRHTQERRFQCQYCGLKFLDSQKVKIHVRTHTGEKPYKCGLCEARFASNSNMWQHCAYVHGKSTKTHHCPHCPLTFAAKGKLKAHLKTSHPLDSAVSMDTSQTAEGHHPVVTGDGSQSRDGDCIRDAHQTADYHRTIVTMEGDQTRSGHRALVTEDVNQSMGSHLTTENNLTKDGHLMVITGTIDTSQMKQPSHYS